MEDNASFLTIHEGGGEQAEIIETLNTTMSNTRISTPRNQIFVVFNTIGNKIIVLQMQQYLYL